MEKLAQYLVDRKITKAEFARQIGVSRGNVCDLVSGRRNPGPNTIFAIERATGGEIPAEAWTAIAREQWEAKQ